VVSAFGVSAVARERGVSALGGSVGRGGGAVSTFGSSAVAREVGRATNANKQAATTSQRRNIISPAKNAARWKAAFEQNEFWGEPTVAIQHFECQCH
jgi:hypothetical protein